MLHYIKNDAPFSGNRNDFLLVDAGTEFNLYASDITRTYPVGGKFSGDHKVVYEIVLEAMNSVIEKLKPGVAYEDLHRLALRIICQGLQKVCPTLMQAGILVGSTKDLISNHVPAIFFPHGLGHFLGLDVHDCGGYPKGVDRIQEPGIRYLRMRRVLQQGHVITIEPGCYFVDALIDPALADPKLAKFFNTEILNRFRAVGGVRIEDDIAITETGYDILSKSVPKTVEEIEAVMRVS